MTLTFGSIEAVEKRHLSIKDEKMIAVMKIQQEIMRAARTFLYKQGFTELLPPIMSSATDPGLRKAHQAVVDFYGKEYKLMGSMLLHKQMAITAIDKIFAFSPNIRLEDPATQKTGRHLAEFWQLDLEAAHTSREEIMQLGEKLLIYIIKSVKKACPEQLEQFERHLKIPERPFKILTHARAVEKLKKMGFQLAADEEIPWDAEQRLSKKYDRPFWITDYPDGSRGFYDRPDPERAGLLKDMDLLYPDGHGEAISGGERVHTYEQAIAQMKKTSIDPSDYGWYLEMLKHGVPPSAGFGLGIERLTRFICGLQTVWQAGPFVKVPAVYSP
ncbi:MAG: asparagine ligase [Candidatus Aenigmarchaeota archaeon ex4484_14]|nr:MAG: asparagine ligase [Candidatus Aenigmarchaeota archaeon ex4484_14]